MLKTRIREGGDGRESGDVGDGLAQLATPGVGPLDASGFQKGGRASSPAARGSLNGAVGGPTTSKGPHLTRCAVLRGCICDPDASLCPRTLSLADRARRGALDAAWRGFLSSAWCINLLERPDRLEKMTAKLHAAGLCRLVMFYRTRRATTKDHPVYAGYFGCWESHRATCALVQNHFRAHSDKNHFGMVLEDDAEFDLDLLRPEVLRAVGAYVLKERHSMDVFYLGHAPISGGVPLPLSGIGEGLTVLQVRAVLLHAYLWTPRGAKAFWAHGTFGAQGEVGVDQWIRRYLDQRALFPQLAVQADALSSNLNGRDLQPQSPSNEEKVAAASVGSPASSEHDGQIVARTGRVSSVPGEAGVPRPEQDGQLEAQKERGVGSGRAEGGLARLEFVMPAAPHQAFVARWHWLMDVFYCFVTPLFFFVLLPYLVVAAFLGWRALLCALLISLVVAFVGGAILGVRAHRAKHSARRNSKLPSSNSPPS